MDARRLTGSPTYLVVGVVTWPLVRFGLRGRWYGAQNVPESGGAVLAANHESNFDPWPLSLGVFPRRALRFMTKAELFRTPLRPILNALGGFPVDRTASDRRALETAVQLCRDGHIVLMFPEGTRRNKGLRRKLGLRRKFVPTPHTGAARIALRAGVPLIPAAITGTDRLSRLGPVRVSYGPPVEVGDLASLNHRARAQQATDRLMSAIAALETELSTKR